jgi:hypothetical protein
MRVRIAHRELKWEIPIMEVLNNIPVKLDLEAVLRRIRVRNRNERLEKSVKELVEVARPIARPKAVYEVSYVENRNEDSLDVGGVRFTSRILRVNLDKVERVFPYVVTCGRELDEIDFPSQEFIKSYYLDQIKETVLVLARKYLEDYLTGKYALGRMSKMAPGAGSVDDWPITQQEGLFAIFGSRDKVEELIGVRLTDKCLMIPVKSVSGIYFPTEIKFEACQLCPREGCIGRRAPYNPGFVEKYRSALV